MATNADILGEVPFFAMLDSSERAALAERVDELRVKKGEVLFEIGHPGDALYVVRSGEVELWVKRQTGERVVLETAKAGDFFGEISLLDGGPRNATATVLEDAELIEVDRGDLDELFRVKPTAAMDLLTATGRRLRETSRLLRSGAAKNVNEETEDKSSTVERAADWVTEFSGSIAFLLIHIALFIVWIVLNVPPLAHKSPGGFDPFPFGLLTMSVSLEAIILSVLVMLSQNRQVARDRIKNDIEYNINVSAEAKVAHLHEKIDTLTERLMSRLDRLEKADRTRTDGAPSGRTGERI
ncbi:MAG: DUF1003 domain-containing protein [Polyangiaceae bacterium]